MTTFLGPDHGKERIEKDGAMKGKLYIFIGDSGDYSQVQRLASTERRMSWSSIKGAQLGDRVLIYIRNPYSALVAEAKVLSKPVKGRPGDYAYRARVGQFELLPREFTIHDLKRTFPRWRWLWRPRGKAIVPERYMTPLWNLVHHNHSNVQILIGSVDYGGGRLEKLASSGRSQMWYVPRLAAPGDTVFFYLADPVSAIVAKGRVMSRPRATNTKWYEAKVGRVQFIRAPIHLEELRKMFPDWDWLRSVNMFSYVSPSRARALLDRSERKSPSGNESTPSQVGAGFGTPKVNRLVERSAIRFVTRYFRRRGYRVVSREKENIGYDLEARKDSTELHIEVKGVSGDAVQFPITRGELRRAGRDSAFRLVVVTRARERQPRMYNYGGHELRNRFSFRPLAYLAVKTRRH